MASLTGCLWGAVAGSGAGYVFAKEAKKSKEKQTRAIERHAIREDREKREAEKQRAISMDGRITSEINKKFIGGELTKVVAIHTFVQNGTVVLYGNVPSKSVADRAVDIARHIDGVRQVISKLVVVEVKIEASGRSTPHIQNPDTYPEAPIPAQVIPPVAPQQYAPPPQGYYPPPQPAYIPQQQYYQPQPAYIPPQQQYYAPPPQTSYQPQRPVAGTNPNVGRQRSYKDAHPLFDNKASKAPLPSYEDNDDIYYFMF